MKTTRLSVPMALCAALLAGCGDDDAAARDREKTVVPPAAPASAPVTPAPTVPAAKAPAPVPPAGTLDAAATGVVAPPATTPTSDALAAAAADAAAQAALDRIQTQEELDAIAASEISSDNSDEVFEALAEEIEKDDG